MGGRLGFAQVPVYKGPRSRLEDQLAFIEDTRPAAALFALLEAPNEPLTRARRRLLRELTAHDLGDDRRAWLGWWQSNRQRTRLEWLLDGLLDGNRTLRAEAARQLRELTGESFGFDPGMKRRQRKVVRDEYREWRAYKRWQVDL
jgi:hypothetical protein